MEKRYREKIYSHYIKNHFGAAHDPNDLQKDYKLHSRYFNKNYKKYISADTNCKILDAGCGMGHFLYFAKQHGYNNVIGIDVSAELVELCKKNGFNALLTDISSFLKQHPDTFDVIIFNDVIEHLTKDEITDMLELMHLALKKGGCLLVKTPNMANPITAAGGRYIDFTHEIGFTETSLSAILKATGFSETKVVGTDIYVLYENPLNYVSKLVAWLLSKFLFLLSYMYGRNMLKIYEKDILAIAYK